MTVDDSIRLQHHTKNAALGGGRRPVTDESASGCEAGAVTTPEKQSRRGNARGVSECHQQFTTDRQRLLRSWLALQGQAPAHIIADELVSTISALRQLVELRE
jgi:hypothetical protein